MATTATATAAVASAARRTTRALVGLALVAAAFGLVALLGIGFDTTFAKTSVSCGSAVGEAWPEQRPAGPTADEIEYLRETGNWRAADEYRLDAVRYLEAKACGRAARFRLATLGSAATGLWVVGGTVVRRALRRRPRRPSVL